MSTIRFITLTTLLLAPWAAMPAAEAPKPDSPITGAVVYAPHPHFRWQREAGVRIDEVHRIQIARDELFVDIAYDDRLEVVSRFVPVRPLAPGKYWWRVRRGEGDWSKAVSFEVRFPEHVLTVHAGSDAETVAGVIHAATENCPARVNFEPGDYHFTAADWKGVASLEKAHDVIVDGQGAHLALAGTFLSVFN